MAKRRGNAAIYLLGMMVGGCAILSGGNAVDTVVTSAERTGADTSDAISDREVANAAISRRVRGNGSLDEQK